MCSTTARVRPPTMRLPFRCDLVFEIVVVVFELVVVDFEVVAHSDDSAGASAGVSSAGASATASAAGSAASAAGASAAGASPRRRAGAGRGLGGLWCRPSRLRRRGGARLGRGGSRGTVLGAVLLPHAADLEQLADLLGGLRALLDPRQRAVAVDADDRRFGTRGVLAEDLDETTVAGAA